MTAPAPAPVRTVEQIDRELQGLVKAKASSRAIIQSHMGQIVAATGQIDRLLAERSALTDSCPPDAATLVAS
jgi:hypothetical protein